MGTSMSTERARHLVPTPAIWLITLGAIVAVGCGGGDCTLTPNADGTATLQCGDADPIIIENGADGMDGTDGATCTAVDNGDGTTTVSCSDGTTITIENGANGMDGTSCTVVDNGDGTRTITCDDGSTVTVRNGTDGGDLRIPNFHGEDHLLSSGEYADGAKTFVDATITSATADAAGLVTVDFSVADRDGDPVTTLTAVNANIAKLTPAAGGDASNAWVNYIYRTQTVTGTGSWPAPDGTSAEQAYLESTGTFTNHGDGTYTYVYATNLATAMRGGALVGYDRALTHRVVIMMGGHAGPTATANFDFVPDGSAMTETRDIVETATCQHCHGENEFHGHGGDRLTVESCVTCHNPGNIDPHGGESLDMRVMVHRIHAGGELATIPGPDGVVWDDPATSADESADNDHYTIWGYRDTPHEWWEVGFPAIIENCTACHQGSGAEVDNWESNPGREACGSCHNDIDFAAGTNHGGGAVTMDSCTGCHNGGIAPTVEEAHNWTEHDPRNIPEFTANLTVSTPGNGTHFVAGERPVVTLVLTDAVTGTVIDHTTVLEDSSAEGCTLPGPCPARDGLFRGASLFVHGPRAHRVPVLTTAARSQVLSSGTGTFDLSAATGSLTITFDQDSSLHATVAGGGDTSIPGTISVPVSSLPAARSALTVAELVTWLNSNTAFAQRGIAETYADGRLSVRSRNLGPIFGIQLAAGAVNTAVFGGDVAIHMPTGSTPGNNCAARTNPANNDPKAVRTTGAITYTLDPVDDLEPGTYIIGIEFADRGNSSNTNYSTPTVARTNFQVGTATEEPLVADNCSTCHQNNHSDTAVGFVLDFRRHYKVFNDTALDQCGSCHDYMPQDTTGTTSWRGARPISRRVHGIHNGANLNYPLWTVDYSNGDPVAGRAWRIGFPQDIRNCETCHSDDTSGTWATQPAVLPCSGCHDSDASWAHMRLMTYDPTPGTPWSGDEVESCQTCH